MDREFDTGLFDVKKRNFFKSLQKRNKCKEQHRKLAEKISFGSSGISYYIPCYNIYFGMNSI